MLKIGNKIYVADGEIDCETGLPILKLVTIKTLITEYEIIDENGYSNVINYKEIKGLPEI